MTSPHIGFLCGSLRMGSINRTLEKALIRRAKNKGVSTTKINLATYDLPLYHGDMDVPAGVKKLAREMSGCDGIIIVTPEYNGGLPPLLKNAIDWVSTMAQKPFTNPVYGIASCTPGPMSGIMCMRQVNYILMRVGAEVVPTQVGTGQAAKAFNAQGELIAEPSSTLADKMLDQVILRIIQKRG